MNANYSQDLKLKLAKEFKQLNSFIDRYAFYEQHKRELNYEDPQDPLMIEFNQCNEELRKFDEGKMPKSVEAVYRTDLQESTVINKRKFEIIELLKKQNEELGVYKPEPSSDDEWGKMIEYRVKQFEPSPSFEELKKNFKIKINGADVEQEIVEKELEKINKKLEGYNADMVSLLSRATKKYKINFLGFYRTAKEEEEEKEKKSYYPLSFNYAKLASAIPLVQFRNFLKNYPLGKVENIDKPKEIYISPQNIEPIYNALAPYFRGDEIKLRQLLEGEAIEEKVRFNESAKVLCNTFNTLHEAGRIGATIDQIKVWICKYFQANRKPYDLTEGSTLHRYFQEKIEMQGQILLPTIRSLITFSKS